jgi:hypothetical protein
MLANILDSLQHLESWLHSPFVLLALAFQIWMLVDAIRRQEWFWAALIFFFSFITALLYFFLVYRQAVPATRGFELPGAYDRKRIKELQAQIHHLDKAHHHSQLGDIYLHQGKLDKAEASYRDALEREPEDIDTRAHLGLCLLHQSKPAEAKPLLERVCQQDPKHDYGYSLMALAETLTALGETAAAMQVWQHVTSQHTYPRAHVQLAELYLANDQPELARQQLQEVLADAPHAPSFQKRRDRHWIRRASRLIRTIPPSCPT